MNSQKISILLAILLLATNIWAQKAQVINVEDNGSLADFWIWNANVNSFVKATAAPFPYFDIGDAFVTGDVLGDQLDEILVAEDNGGSVDIWTWNPSGNNFYKVFAFESTNGGNPFDIGDAIVMGDLFNDGKEEIIIVEDDGGSADIWTFNPDVKNIFRTHIVNTYYSGKGGAAHAIACGDVLGDGKDEIVSANNWINIGQVWSQSWNPVQHAFDSFGFFPSFDYGDALAVGNVLGDNKEEILIAEDNGGAIEIWSWNASTQKFNAVQRLSTYFDVGDALVTGDVWGDDKDEILVAEDNGGSIEVYAYDSQNNRFYRVSILETKFGFHPFDVNDALVTGKCMRFY